MTEDNKQNFRYKLKGKKLKTKGKKLFVCVCIAHYLSHFLLPEAQLFNNYAKPFVISNARGSQKKEKKNAGKRMVEF